MKILAISDIRNWEGYEKLLDKIKPEIIILAGDLTSDGFASFWNEAIEKIPEYKKELKINSITNEGKIYRWKNNKKPKKHKDKNILDVINEIRNKYKNSKEFLEIRKKIHVDKFYQFLQYAGEKSKVLIIKGDHDEDFKDDYIVEKIDNIKGCNEISGKLIELNKFKILGLGFKDTHYLKILKPIIEKFKGKIDIVITHCEQNKMQFLSLLKPKMIIRGHFGSGRYLVNEVPSVFTADVSYTIIEIDKKTKFPRISQYITKGNKNILLKKGSCRPWFSDKSEFKIYDWFKPYPSTATLKNN